MSQTAVFVSLVGLVLLWGSVRAVPPGHAYVVELLRSRYRRTLEPGVHVLIPLLESVRAKVAMGEQTGNFGPHAAITSDDLVACVSTVVYHRVVDPVRATYEIADRALAVEVVTEHVLRVLAASSTFDGLRGNPHQLAAQLPGMLNEKTADFGVQVLRAEITAIEEGSRSGCR